MVFYLDGWKLFVWPRLLGNFNQQQIQRHEWGELVFPSMALTFFI